MRRLFFVILAAVSVLGQAAQARCQGEDLIAALPPEELAALRADADAVPFAHGNAWHATRGKQELYIIGTLHLDDPRHAATIAAVLPLMKLTSLLLVEAGPDEERLLKARLAKDPSLLVSVTGPTLREALSEADWQIFQSAMTARGVPVFLASKLQPWYVSVLLALPPCAIAAGVPNGLDQRLMAAATEAGIPIVGLEPYDTAFKVFQNTAPEDQIKMLIGALSAEVQSEDMNATTINSYFAEDTRLSWEFTKAWTAKLPQYDTASAEAEFKMIEDNLMIARNLSWIPTIEARAVSAMGPILVAVGALHLAGERGVLNLLQQKGFVVTRIAFQ